MIMFWLKKVVGLAVQTPHSVRNVSSTSPVFVRLTPALLAEPLKKKKKLDPAIVRQREERKRKKIEKQIRRLEKNSKQLKPIDECEVPTEILKDPTRQRVVSLSQETKYQRLEVFKQWSAYRRRQMLRDVQMFDRILYSQQKALDELKLESKELYDEAIKFDENLIPFKCQGPVETPPINNYDSPDGEYIDISKKWTT
ncbi:39S ribosomal protein L40, mitochondrial [Cimex lectularius]|uniref:Large ribosomal subunit protein mL40 n=1 Tax=Cimex lectularius TaxID=79782 RepID=A0A8I6RJU6_CIMLE|nr:39S ribosomal protein L40, mitochondrial [Cimex lectularius]